MAASFIPKPCTL
ncbi:hypothetical protein A2U01_0048598, partial [Trifolium medium]|nr:hypothetical protein [Trifolium medium]